MRQFAVIGLGRFGYSVAETLIKKGFEVLAIDIDEAKIESVSDFATYAVQCDATDEKALKAVSTQNVDVAVVSIGENIEASILIVMTLKELGVKEIIAKAVTPTQGKVLQNLGVNRVIYPERDAAIRLAHSLIAPNILEHLELSPGYSIIEIPIPSKLVGKRLKDSEVRTHFNVNIIAIRRMNARLVKGKEVVEEEVNFNPSADETLHKEDILVVIGKEENLERISTLQ
ncbi:MAG TPA: TrkA family potassium uptake protein [Nitrospiria bacterium]|jgi:trk system potassium uptake protein TrkA